MFLDSDPEDLSAGTQAGNDHDFEFIDHDNDVATHDGHHHYDDIATDNYDHGTTADNCSTSRSSDGLHSALRRRHLLRTG